MARVIMNISKRYVDDNGFLHREDGPAVIQPDGSYSHYHHGRRQGVSFYEDGGKIFYDYGLITADNHPALSMPNGMKRWWFQNKCVFPKL